MARRNRNELLYKNSKNYTVIEHDLFDIAHRIKLIEQGYFIVRNHIKKTFEVHSSDNIGSSYCFTVPYSELDCRTLQLCKKTNIGMHGDKVFEEMEKENEKFEKAQEKEQDEKLEEFVDVFQYHAKKLADENNIIII